MRKSTVLVCHLHSLFPFNSLTRSARGRHNAGLFGYTTSHTYAALRYQSPMLTSRRRSVQPVFVSCKCAFVLWENSTVQAKTANVTVEGWYSTVQTVGSETEVQVQKGTVLILVSMRLRPRRHIYNYTTLSTIHTSIPWPSALVRTRWTTTSARCSLVRFNCEPGASVAAPPSLPRIECCRAGCR
ncbi:hypothetical protein EXIGLDRAFT_481900 [Exidia glandulosa HHB12029]|uniref:Uncharacterized protein n=1 Tax=Exidia glandulosa HHB12029 TaxID=1314781 RepID=A0A165PHE9_EXIGL|nr:hypothetical protein EXIGLDRAFT_481900 [Exidia glandulosa HHB12029]